MNTHEKGKQLELMVSEMLQEIFQETPPIRITKASSGGSHNCEIGDCLSQNVYCEVKNDGKWLTLRVWQKLLNSLPLNTAKIPLYVQHHEIEGTMIALTFNDFCRLLKNKND